MPRFLIVRGDDFVHVGVDWSGFTLEQPSAGSGNRPRLRATGGRAQIELTFPPQALAEPLKDATRPTATLPSRRAGTSRITFKVPGGTVVELTASGILQALLNPGVQMVQGEAAARIGR